MYSAEKNFFVHGLLKFAHAVAYHSWHNLPATFSQPRTKKFSQRCIMGRGAPHESVDINQKYVLHVFVALAKLPFS